MKRIVLFSVITFICIFSASAAFCNGNNPYKQGFPLPGESYADAILQRDTFMPVWAYTKALNDTCEDISVVNTKVTQPPQDIKVKNGIPVEGLWGEVWTVNYCGKTKDYSILFTLDGHGGAYYSVKMK